MGSPPLDGIRSLAYRTDIGLLQRSGSQVEDRGDHLVVRTPDNPNFWWGNFVLLPTAPEPADDVARWVAAFEDAFPDALHRAVGLDDPDAGSADLDGFVALGWEQARDAVMTTETVPAPARRAEDATFRALASDEDWEQSVALQLTVYPESGVRGLAFATARAHSRRTLVEAGNAYWVGGFVDGQLVSQLGIVRTEPGLARYQDVETHAAFRRRGYAGELVHLAGRLAQEELGALTLVMVADPLDNAIRLYRALGFVASEHQLQVDRPPPEDA